MRMSTDHNFLVSTDHPLTDVLPTWSPATVVQQAVRCVVKERTLMLVEYMCAILLSVSSFYPLLKTRFEPSCL